MPSKTHPRRRYKKRSKRRTRRSYGTVARYSKYTNNVGLPRNKVVRLTYTSHIELSSSVGTVQSNLFSLMNIVDPDTTGADNHKPLGYAQWANFYEKYTVLGAKVTCLFANKTTNTVPHAVGVLFDKDGAITTGLDARRERDPRSAKVLLCNNRERVKIVKYFSTKKAFSLAGLTQDHQVSQAFGSAPPLTYYALPWMQPVDESTGSGAYVTCDMTIEYLILLRDPKDVPQSL